MPRPDLKTSSCPVARSLEQVGDAWSMLILRDALGGLTRFDEFQKSLAIAPNILSRRLRALVDDGLLERRRYSERPPRDEYVTTDCCIDFLPVIQALMAYGIRRFSNDGATLLISNTETGELADPVLIDRISGRPMSDPVFKVMPAAAPADSAG